MNKTFNSWINTFLSEKNIDLETVLEVEGPSGPNFIPVGCLVEMMKATSRQEQVGLKNMMVRIDFNNGNILDYFKHLAKAVAC